jgi:hypothetical protein
MLPVEVTVTAPGPAFKATIPTALSPMVAMLPVEVTMVAAATATASAVSENPVRDVARCDDVAGRCHRQVAGGVGKNSGGLVQGIPAVVMPKAPVLLVMVRSPAAIKLIPRVPLAGAIAWVRLLRLSVVTGGAWSRYRRRSRRIDCRCRSRWCRRRISCRHQAPPAPGRRTPATARRRQPYPETHPGNANRADTQYRLDKPRRSSLKSSSLKKYNLGGTDIE